MTANVQTKPAPADQACDKCRAPATIVQWWYRDNADDRNGPIVTLRCDEHRAS